MIGQTAQADAVAGVVNFITREDFDGFRVETSYYTTEEGDSDTLDINISYGKFVLNTGLEGKIQRPQGHGLHSSTLNIFHYFNLM